MYIIIYKSKLHTSELNINDLCFNSNTKPLKYYIVHDIIIEDNIIYYNVADTRFGRKRLIQEDILIKPFIKQCTTN